MRVVIAYAHVAFAQAKIVTLSLLTLYSGALLSLRETSILVGRDFQKRPVSSQLYTWSNVKPSSSMILNKLSPKGCTKSALALNSHLVLQADGSRIDADNP